MAGLATNIKTLACNPAIIEGLKSTELAVGQHKIVAVTMRIAKHVLKVVITKNYAHDDGDTLPPTPHPIISSLLEPGDLQGWSMFDYMMAYMKACENYW